MIAMWKRPVLDRDSSEKVSKRKVQIFDIQWEIAIFKPPNLPSFCNKINENLNARLDRNCRLWPEHKFHPFEKFIVDLDFGIVWIRKV
jgi:hypothetical protein